MSEFQKFDNFLAKTYLNTGKNNFVPQNNNTAVTEEKSNHPEAKAVSQKIDTNIKDEFQKQKKNNGLFEKLYDKLKNSTGFGKGSKYVDSVISQYEQGKASKEDVDIAIDKYKKSQKNSEQMFGNVVTSFVTIGAFFKGKNLLGDLRARKELNAVSPVFVIIKEMINDSIKFGSKNSQKVNKLLDFGRSILKSDKKALLFALPVLALMGGSTKLWVLGLNRIGSKEFTPDKELKKTDLTKYKEQKKQLSKAGRKESFKNFITGAGLGIITPITAVLGGIAGVPAFIAGVTGLNYLTSNEKNKSFDGYIKSIKDNWAMNAVGAAVMAVFAFKKARFSSVLSKNLDETVKLLKNVELKPSEFSSGKTNYETIKDIMLESPSIKKILKNESGLNIEEQIRRLTNENIFAVKFLQTSGENSELVKTLIEDCPPSRTLNEAQKAVNKLTGNTNYKIEKLLGVGTVAETYLAKDKSGKEVCVKILKDGLSAQKIQKDKEAFIKLVTGGKAKNKLTKEQDYIIRCIEDYANGITKEVDLENEMKAAKALKQFTKKANVVVPIEAKPGIYVMEKAKGISVQTLKEYYECTHMLKFYEKAAKKCSNDDYYTKAIQKYKDKLAKIKAKAPDFDDFDLSNSEIKKILMKYIDLQTEQFSKLSRSGKTLHADIHPGNVIINLDAVKGKEKGKMFTLIDTGNVINITKEQSLDMLKFIDYIKNANVVDISRAVVADSVLPKGLTREEAAKLVEKELTKCFFDNSTKINTMTIDNLFVLTDNIQKKFNIIPNNTQLNLQKAKNASAKSFNQLVQTFFEKKYGDIDKPSAMELIKATKDVADMGKKMLFATKIQELKNLFKKSFGEIIKSIFNKNNKKPNSIEALTYKLKQDINGAMNMEEAMKALGS